MTPEEIAFVERTVPQTRYLDEKEVNLDAIRADKDAWIIKPTDAYGAADVYAGCFQTQGAMGADHREVRQRGRRRPPSLVAALHHAVQDADPHARRRHRRYVR